MDEKNLEAQIGALRQRVEELRRYVPAPDASEGDSREALEKVQALLDRLGAQTEKLLDTAAQGYQKPGRGWGYEGGQLGRLLVDSFPYPTIIIGQDRTILFANRHACELGAKVAGRCWNDMYGGAFVATRDDSDLDPGGGGSEVPSCSFCRCEEALETGESLHYPDVEAGGRVWDTYWVPLDKDTCLHYCVDVTERREVMERLCKSEEKQRQLIESLNEGIWTIDKEGYTTFVNPRMAEMLGYEADEMPGKHLFSFMDEANIEICKHYINRRQEGIREQHDFEFLRKDGTQVYTRVGTSPIFDDQGNYDGATAGVADITPHKRAEEQLRKSEERYRTVVEDMPAMICRYLPDGTLTFVNDAYCAYRGKKRKELIGFSFFNFLPPKRQEDLREHYRSFDRARPFKSNEFRIPAPDGSIRWERWTDRALFDERGSVIEYQSIGEDVTDRKRAEQVLRETKEHLELRVRERTADLATAIDELQVEARERIETEKALAEANELLERMFSNIELMVAYMNRDFNFIRVNRAYAAADGHSPEFFVGKNHFDLYPNPENEAIFRKVLETGESFFTYEKPFKYRDHPERGVTYWDWSLQAVLEPGGEAGGLVLCLVDVTERIRAREEAEKQRRRLFAVLDLLPGYVHLVGPDHSILFANQTFRNQFGYADRDKCYKVIRGIDQPCEVCTMNDVLTTQQPAVGEWTSEKGRCYRVHCYPFSDIDGSQLSLHLGIDITDSKILEKEILEVGVKERRRIGQDLHDSLGQILTGVAFLSKVLQEKLRRKSLPEASDAAEIARQITESISLTRSLARGLSPVKVEADGLMDALGEYAADIQDLYHISCVFKCDRNILIPDSLVAIQVYHIAQEAVNNAIQHGKAGNILIRLDDDGRMINLTVTDDGKGLPGKMDSRKGMGMRIMDYRARSIGGAFQISAGPEGGTVVRCSFKKHSAALES